MTTRSFAIAGVALALWLIPGLAAAGPEETWVDRWQVNAVKR